MNIATTFVLPAITSIVFLVWFILDRSVEAGAMLVISIAALVINAVIQYRNNDGMWKKVKNEKKGWLYNINVRTSESLDSYISDLKSELRGIYEYRVFKGADEFKVISVLMAQPIELPEMYKSAREIGIKYGVKTYFCEDQKSKYGLLGDGIEDGLGFH
ncbi:hypothetical protein [Thalassolituus sp.]|uniref:hypothetical protein n=1 Tax=Thalassolituus sp. TaxID=2030822 RepID=UPI0032D97E44